MINIKELAISDVKLLTPKLHQDERGFVGEIIHDQVLSELSAQLRFVQENQSFSHKKHTVRALHYQKPPHAQAKLVRVLRGKIFDVAVDMRPTSPTYGKHVSAILSDDDMVQMYVPPGFAHGICTLEDDTMVLYKMSDFYAPESEGGVAWNDPDLKIPWPVDEGKAILSERDKNLPRFKEIAPMKW